MPFSPTFRTGKLRFKQWPLHNKNPNKQKAAYMNMTEIFATKSNDNNDTNALSSTLQSTAYQPELYTAAACDFATWFDSATEAADATVEYDSAKELIISIDALKAQVAARIAEIEQIAKDQTMLAELKQMLENGAGIDEINAKVASHRLAASKTGGSTSKRSPDAKAPKVHENLATPDHNDFKWGYTGSLRNLDSSKTSQAWAKKRPDGSADPDHFRKATEQELAVMQHRRDEFIKIEAAKRATKA